MLLQLEDWDTLSDKAVILDCHFSSFCTLALASSLSCQGRYLFLFGRGCTHKTLPYMVRTQGITLYGVHASQPTSKCILQECLVQFELDRGQGGVYQDFLFRRNLQLYVTLQSPQQKWSQNLQSEVSVSIATNQTSDEKYLMKC